MQIPQTFKEQRKTFKLGWREVPLGARIILAIGFGVLITAAGINTLTLNPLGLATIGLTLTVLVAVIAVITYLGRATRTQE